VYKEKERGVIMSIEHSQANELDKSAHDPLREEIARILVANALSDPKYGPKRIISDTEFEKRVQAMAATKFLESDQDERPLQS
jgi:hypothetical protein